MGLNQAIIVGRLGGDPELKFIPSGKAVANFNVATDSVWKDRDGNKQKQTEWHKIVVWGPQAETCAKYLAKGREVCIVGEIRTRSYDDKDGVKRYVTEIVARDVRFIGGNGGQGRQDDFEPNGPVDDSEIPF